MLNQVKYILDDNEYSLFLFILSRIQSQDKVIKDCKVTTKDLVAAGFINNSSQYESAKDKLTKFLHKELRITSADKNYIHAGWISSFEFKLAEKAFILGFNPKVTQSLLKLKKDINHSTEK